MLIGAMNHPARPLAEQIAWLGEKGFDFLDRTLEPPEAASWNVDPGNISDALAKCHLRVVGHTAPFLPIANPVPELRRAALLELQRCMGVFREVGARWLNVHPHIPPVHDRALAIALNLESLGELLKYGRGAGVGVMVENTPGAFNTVEEIGELLEPLPDLGLHLDIGHANLMVARNMTEDLLAAYGSRVKHVHLHDNRGGNLDLHLPLGAGNIDLARSLRALRASGYDGTITLEVFAPDPHHLLYSRDLLRRTWDEMQ